MKGRVEYLVTGDNDVKTDQKVLDFLAQSSISVLSVAKFLTIIDEKS